MYPSMDVALLLLYLGLGALRVSVARLRRGPLRPSWPWGYEVMIFAQKAFNARVARRSLQEERRAWDAFRPRLVAAVAALRLGDPDDPVTDVAPLAEGRARAEARAALAQALAAGAEVLVGEGERGPFFTPTVLHLPREALAGLDLWRQESFAPLRGLVVADDPDDAVALANDTPFALGAAVFGPGEAIVPRLRAARVLQDEGPLYQDPHFVVGGVGDSGLAGARPKIEQLVWARRVHRAEGRSGP